MKHGTTNVKVSTIIWGLPGRADEDNAILREAGNGLSADTV
jgi:hypothetical protein